MHWPLSIDDTLIAIGIFALSLLVSTVVVGALVVLIDADHFVRPDARPLAGGVRGVVVRVGKNLLGGVLVVVGIALSLPGVPGQGLLTILVGITLIDLPSKRRLELKLVSRPLVRRTLDRVRVRFGRPPLRLLPEPTEGSRRPSDRIERP